MTNSDNMKTTIQIQLKDLITRIFQEALEKSQSKERYGGELSLYETFLPDEIRKSAYFERQFIAEFREVWKNLAVAIANQNWGYSVKNHEIFGTIKLGRLRRIQHVINASYFVGKDWLETDSNWEAEVAYILKGKGQPIPVRVTCDVYVEDPVSHKKYAYVLKAPFPQWDHDKIRTEKLLQLHSMDPPQIDGAYYALPYYPYEKREDYMGDFPVRWFNSKETPIVLIGSEFWEKIGGAGTYQALIEALNEIGQEYKERIFREYLGIEPSKGADLGVLF